VRTTQRLQFLICSSLAVLGAGSYAAADTITLALPASGSTALGVQSGGTSGGTTGVGIGNIKVGGGVRGGGSQGSTGDFVSQTYTSTGLPATDASRWVFDMSTSSATGVATTFDAMINGTTVGTYQLLGTGSSQTVHFDLNFTSPVITGDTYTLRTQAESGSGGGSTGGVTWSWLPGGNVSL